MDELLCEFLTETNENISVLDIEIVKLEQNPNDPELLGNIFRLMHTIKGTCGFLGLPRLEKIAHSAENVLGKIRDGEITVTPEAITAVLDALDIIKYIISELEQTQQEPDGNDNELIQRLDAIIGVDSISSSDSNNPDLENSSDLNIDEEIPSEEINLVEQSDEVIIPEVKEDNVKPEAKEVKSSNEKSLSTQSIRVSVDLLENLMTMVSELVLTRNQLLQMVRGKSDSEFGVPLQRLSHITSELQDNVMKTRMQPIGNAWAKLPRIVRDIATDLNKKIDLQMIGADTELDRQVLELIKDPLTHMIRNSADHGLEIPDDRIKVGKSEIGTIKLNAFHEGGHIIVEISDDGKGLSTEKIKEKAITNKIIDPSEAESLSEKQIQQLIFKAGFSTAEKVTNVSGRGVGMDVVRTNIEKIGGNIELWSQEGTGTKFTIKIPLTLAIISALIIESSNERFAIPQISVVELVRSSETSDNKIEMINDTPVLRLRDRLLPLVSLKQLLKVNNDGEEIEKISKENYIIVTQVGTHSFGIIVDKVFDTEEIVVKPVAPLLRDISLFSGNTILGDGSVVMILDPNGIALQIGETSVDEESLHRESVTNEIFAGEKIAFIIFNAGNDTPKAVPLELISRLEEFSKEDIEFSDGVPVIQYRGQLMPLASLDGSYFDKENSSTQSVLVFSDNNHVMGLLVDEILDIVEDKLQIEVTIDKPGYIGTTVINSKSTELIDASYYLTKAFPDWFISDNEAGSTETNDQAKVLLIDDSAFFRNLLKPILNVAGYSVTTVESGEKAMNLCDSGEEFDAIISDIEMPGMNGFELAEKIKNNNTKWCDKPLLALSAHTTDKDLETGRNAGFDDFIAKNDREALLYSLSNTLSKRSNVA